MDIFGDIKLSDLLLQLLSENKRLAVLLKECEEKSRPAGETRLAAGSFGLKEHASVNRFGAVAAKMSHVIAIADESMTVCYATPGAVKLFGHNLCGEKIFNYICAEDIRRFRKMAGGILSGEKTADTDEFRVRRENTARYIELTASNCISDPEIGGILIEIHDITKYKEREREIEYRCYIDSLTGLYNREYFVKETARLNHRDYMPLSVIMGDINRLKIINDGFGHSEGDTILKKTAENLKFCCRKNDIICRIGGDEFCILLPRTDSASAQKICKRIYEVYENDGAENGAVIKTSISLGCDTLTEPGGNLDDTIKKAEILMYRHKLTESRMMHRSLISSIKATMFERSHETEEHTQRMVSLSKAIGRQLDLNDDELSELELLAALHDIGKLSIDPDILNKKSELTKCEWLEIKKHPESGYRIAVSAPELVKIADYILCHHERWDGSGYPQGLKGTEIPILSRIVAVADTYTAITSDRTYREAKTKQYAIDEIRKNSGTQFDPEVVGAFLKAVDNADIIDK